MSPKKTILRTLAREYHTSGPGALVRPGTIPGFRKAPKRYQQAVNALLQERLIEGAQDQEGRLAISLNPHKVEAVRKQLRPLWVHPVFWALLLLALALAGVGLA